MGEYLDYIKRWNCSRLFLLPLLGISADDLSEYGFIDSYLDDTNREERSEGCLYLLFKPDDLYKFGEFLDEQRKQAEILDDYDYEGGFVVVIYKLPEEWSNDYQLFLEGKYSKFSREFKNLFPQVVKVTVNGLRRDVISTQWSIFKKDTNLVKEWEDEIGMEYTSDMELWEAPNFEREVLDISKFEIIKQ